LDTRSAHKSDFDIESRKKNMSGRLAEIIAGGLEIATTRTVPPGLDKSVFFLLPPSSACDNLNPMLCGAHFDFRIAQIRSEKWK
jgi:hypothetical protein